ncbi:uncharacterized protein LOC119768826 isoform X1 [Culex quinquefasciatus]|uniref:uncharacterized protein LOC119768826 isoform X1 n=1 Tax=Culex quinquefasciatus TaxID=7176 RepID=UPI0018E385EF|nr:uncharacterized protein LOC119768826 isoform X1 [Culex quinquefasciatus]
MPEPNRNITLQCSALMSSQLVGVCSVYQRHHPGAIGTSSRLQECRGLSSVGHTLTTEMDKSSTLLASRHRWKARYNAVGVVAPDYPGLKQAVAATEKKAVAAVATTADVK